MKQKFEDWRHRDPVAAGRAVSDLGSPSRDANQFISMVLHHERIDESYQSGGFIVRDWDHFLRFYLQGGMVEPDIVRQWNDWALNPATSPYELAFDANNEFEGFVMPLPRKIKNKTGVRATLAAAPRDLTLSGSVAQAVWRGGSGLIGTEVARRNGWMRADLGQAVANDFAGDDEDMLFDGERGRSGC